MTLTITLTVEEEARLRAAAQREGIDPAELCISLSERIFRQRLTKMPPPLLCCSPGLQRTRRTTQTTYSKPRQSWTHLSRRSTPNANELAHGASIHESRYHTRHRAIGIADQSQEDSLRPGQSRA